MAKSALILGVNGQDGSHLADLLVSKNYAVHGTIRRASTDGCERIAHVRDRLTVHEADLTDMPSLIDVLRRVGPDELYNVAAQSFVPASWGQPILTADVTGLGVARVLEAVRLVCPTTRVYQATSSEVFGKVLETPQSERTPFNPQSPYASAKAFGHHLVGNYRKAYGLYAVSGVCFNHEGPRRGLEFVTRKITHAAARIKAGLQAEVRLGNLESLRDWSYAGDMVEGMWLALQQPEADDYVFASGECHTVREVCEIAFARANLDWRLHVRVDPALYRPAEVDLLLGDPSKAKRVLGWRPKVGFEELIEMMVDADLEAVGVKPADTRIDFPGVPCWLTSAPVTTA